MDPLADKYPGWNPYNYTLNNPVRLVDPNGGTPDDIIIKGANKSSLTIKTSLVNSTINLSDYGSNYDFGGNYSFSTNELKPDAIGLDLGVTGTAGVSITGGVNLLWHTRGEKPSDQYYPEVYAYGGVGAGSDVAVNGSVSLVMAWATNEDGTMASNDYVANGFNWSGDFWSAGIALGEGGYAGGGSYFTSQKPFGIRNKRTWSGIQFGWTPGASATAGMGKLGDVLKNINKFSLGANAMKSYYYLLYGNGSDYLPKTGKDVSGWNILNPIDPADNE